MRTDFRVGDWVVSPRRELIERNGAQIHIHPKSMAVLEYLAGAQGEVVTRQELFENIWPNVVVTDDALTQCIMELRKAFGDTAKKQHIIKTIPKVGFCLVPPIAELRETKGRSKSKWIIASIAVLVLLFSVLFLYKLEREPQGTLAANIPGEEPSVAVLPFVNMSSDPEQEYFSDGVTEELIDLLARVPKLRVISRTSAFSFKGKNPDIGTIARKLNVTHILEGSVRSSGDRIRIATKLIDARSDTPIWSQTFERDFTEIFSIQEEIATQVADKVEVTLMGNLFRFVPADPEAYRLYLLGHYHLNKYDYPMALKYLQRAVALEPKYVQAHIALASWYGGSTFFGNIPPREGYAKIRGQLALALAGDSTLASLHRPIAEMQFYFDWSWAKAEQSFNLAIEAVPSDAYAYQLYAWYLMAMGRTEEAHKFINRGLELEPLAPALYLTASNVFYFAMEHEKAIELCRAALELTPDHPLALSQMGWSYLQLGMFEEAISVMEKSVRLAPHSTQHLWSLGHAYARAGDIAKARDTLTRMRDLAEVRYVMPFGFAMVHIGLEEKQVALDWLERAEEERNGWLVYLGVEPRLDPLRLEPRFMALMERMNYPD